MNNLDQLHAELRATSALWLSEPDPIKRAHLLGECQAIEASIEHEERLEEIARKYAPVRLVGR